MVTSVVCRYGGPACLSLPTASPHACKTGPWLEVLRAGSGLLRPALEVPGRQQSLANWVSHLARDRIISFPSTTRALKELTSKYASLLFVLAVRDGSSPTLSKERGKTKLEYRDREYFADTETGPLLEVKTWTRGWDSGLRRLDSCDHPEEHRILQNCQNMIS